MPNIFVTFTFTIVDAKNKESFMGLFTVAGGQNFTVLELNEAANGILPLIRNCITGGIPRCSISFNADLASLFASFPGIPYPSNNAADVEEGAEFSFTSEYQEEMRFRLATFDEDLLNAGTRDVDVSDSRVAALIALILVGFNLPGGRQIEFCDSRGSLLFYFADGKEKFQRRKRRK